MRVRPAAWVAIMGTLVGSGYIAGTAVKEQLAESATTAERAVAPRVPASSVPPPVAARPFGAPSPTPATGSPGVPEPPAVPDVPTGPDVPAAPGARGPGARADENSPPDTARRGSKAAEANASERNARGRNAAPDRERPPRPVTTMHVPLNAAPADRARAAALGYNLFDVGPDAGEINSLPARSRALIWVGNSTCSSFALSYPEFTAAVRRLAGNPRVYGWYLSDEPNTGECPGIVAEIRKRADYIRKHAPRQRSFASLTDWPLKPLRPSRSHLDLIGLDPYPCRVEQARCDLGAIDKMYGQARRAGFRRSMIVPVFQTFGQTCTSGEKSWRLPTAAELRAILQRWRKLAPNPPFDISYSWGRQSQWACPSLADANGKSGYPDLQSIMRAHNNLR